VRRISRRIPWLLAVAILLLVAYFTHVRWFTWLGECLVKSEPPVSADLVVVLAGDFTGNRIVTAANLVRQGFAAKALVSGPAELYGMYESQLAIPFAVHKGFPESYFIPFPNESKSTTSEAEVIISLLHKLHVHRIDLVTSNFHTRRAAAIFRSQAPDIDTHVVAAPDRYFTPDGWWKNREGRKVFFLEWTKTVASWLGM